MLLLAGCSFTQTNEGLERIANMAVMVLFSSFAGILLPSLANVQDPIGTILAEGTHPDGFTAAASAAVPLLLSCLIYQNIVPSITKLLDFDRTKSTIAIALGSLLPMVMYIAWCFAVLGGGLDNSISGGGVAMFTVFSASALVGSCVACVMSLAEEYESIFSCVIKQGEACPLKNNFSLPAVAMSIIPSATAGLAFSGGEDFTGALHFAGAVISPLLYGILPIVLFKNMQSNENNNKYVVAEPNLSSISQVLLGAGTLGFLGQEIMQDLVSLTNLMA